MYLQMVPPTADRVITIHAFEQIAPLIERLKQGHCLLIQLAMSDDQATRSKDFLSGAMLAIDGKVNVIDDHNLVLEGVKC